MGFEKSCNKWRVRWRSTNRTSKGVFSGSKTFPAKKAALQFLLEIEDQEELYREGNTSLSDSLADAVTEYKRHCHKFTARTQEHYLFVLDRFIDSLPRNGLNFAQITGRILAK